uniref:Uncharacterized protein n=1 Tax=Leersia perrieri TaxID=77586 RepID=A0A0D9XXI1_9ORYZ
MEEFTFPCIPPEQCNGVKKPSFSSSSPQFATPPPWFGAGGDHRRSFSAVENRNGDGDDTARGGGWQWHYCYYDGNGGHCSARFAGGGGGEEAKMDMLWEDFNEELSRAAAAPPCPLSKEWTKEAWLAGDGTPELRCRATPAAANSGSVVRRRRLSLLMMLKLLKKLFLAHKSNAASRKAPPI